MSLARGDWFYVFLMLLDAFFMARPYLYAIQCDNYRISEIFKNRRIRKVYLMDVCAVVVFCVIWLIFYLLQAKAFWGFMISLFFFIAEFAMYFTEDLPNRKKPLKYTKRAVRCLLFVTLCAGAIGSVSLAIATHNLEDEYLRYFVFFGYVLIFPALFMVFASIINVFERLNNRRYERLTCKRLAKRQDLIKIAITGSFGKTSVKNILAQILSQKYNVLATPESYNTPMGVAKTIKSLNATHEVFIAEFGARRRGDIARLMRIVEPNCSILTGINAQHLQTFKTIENIKREKLRILDVKDGVCVVNQEVKADVENSLTKFKIMPELIYVGVDENADVSASEINVSRYGSSFNITIDERKYFAKTKLLGVHNVQNIMLAVAMAIKLGLEMPYILNAIENLEPTPHRMQLIEGNGICVIDDSFNSNPTGAKCALDTLSKFDTRKVVLTPGLVELGEREIEENSVLGERIASVADVVLLVGKRAEEIKRGLKRGEFFGDVYVYDDLSSCEKDFSNTLKIGDTLLILNDLPEWYEERF